MMINRTAGAAPAPVPGLPVPPKPVMGGGPIAAPAASPVATGAITGLLRGGGMQPMGAGTMIPQRPPVPGQPPTRPMGGSGSSRQARTFSRKNTSAPPSFGGGGGSRPGMNIRSMR